VVYATVGVSDSDLVDFVFGVEIGGHIVEVEQQTLVRADVFNQNAGSFE
jgi:hypothetical protein